MSTPPLRSVVPEDYDGVIPGLYEALAEAESLSSGAHPIPSLHTSNSGPNALQPMVDQVVPRTGYSMPWDSDPNFDWGNARPSALIQSDINPGRQISFINGRPISQFQSDISPSRQPSLQPARQRDPEPVYAPLTDADFNYSDDSDDEMPDAQPEQTEDDDDVFQPYVSFSAEMAIWAEQNRHTEVGRRIFAANQAFDEAALGYTAPPREPSPPPAARRRLTQFRPDSHAVVISHGVATVNGRSMPSSAFDLGHHLDWDSDEDDGNDEDDGYDVDDEMDEDDGEIYGDIDGW